MNPKHIQAMKEGKAPLDYLVSTMDPLDAAVHKHGADKYGKLNWRIDKITATTYVAAMRRHLNAWSEGHDLDDGPGGSGKPHLTHLRACCAVVLDAQMHGTLIDNRLDAESKSVQAEAQNQADVAEARAMLGVAGLPPHVCPRCAVLPCHCDAPPDCNCPLCR